MRAYRVDNIRRIEDRAIAVEGVDALMQRAAAAVAASASNLLQSRCGGRYGRHAVMRSLPAYGWPGAEFASQPFGAWAPLTLRGWPRCSQQVAE